MNIRMILTVYKDFIKESFFHNEVLYFFDIFIYYSSRIKRRGKMLFIGFRLIAKLFTSRNVHKNLGSVK